MALGPGNEIQERILDTLTNRCLEHIYIGAEPLLLQTCTPRCVSYHVPPFPQLKKKQVQAETHQRRNLPVES